MRHLASIQRIQAVEPIPGADNIELATVLLWKVIIKKGEFKAGDLCVYCEIDSVFPKLEEYSFLEQTNYRLRTKKFKKFGGVVSQGLCLHLTSELVLMPMITEETTLNDLIGKDVTERLGITKYEPPAPSALSGDVKGDFPWYICQTDQTRIQSCANVLDELYGLPAVATLKADGMSTTVYNNINRGESGVCSHTKERKDTEKDIFWTVTRKYNILEKLLRANLPFAVQGELVGPEIKGSGRYTNPLGLQEHKFLVFDIWDIDRQCYLSWNYVERFCQDYGLETVPIIKRWQFFDIPTSLASCILDLAKGHYPDTDNHREGLVIKPTVEMHSDTLAGRLSFKVINNDYLLGEK